MGIIKLRDNIDISTTRAAPASHRRLSVWGSAIAAILILGLTTAPLSAGAAEQSARDAAQSRVTIAASHSHRIGIGASGLDVAVAKKTAIADRAARVEQARMDAEAAQAAADADAARAAAEASADAAAAQAAADAAAVAPAAYTADSPTSASPSYAAAAAAPAPAPAPAPAVDMGTPPANDDCGPCAGATLVPVVYDGVTYWGCPE